VDGNTIELFDVMHRPSLDMRPFARAKNRRAPMTPLSNENAIPSHARKRV
jgi:hypothetical protein